MAKKVGEPGGVGTDIGGGPGGPPPPPPPPFYPSSYVFILSQFHIDNTRALHEDTDTVSFGVKIGNAMMGDPQIKHMGDVDNGDHPVNLQFGPVLIDNPATPVSINYAIVNAHDPESDTDKALIEGIKKLADAVLAYFGASAWATIANQFVDFFGGLIFGGLCDGPVAADQIQLTGGNLHELTARFNTHTETRAYPGTDSSVGCGSNSFYTVTWTIVRIPPPKGVVIPKLQKA